MMYPRSSGQGGGYGGVDVIPVTRSTLPPAPTMHHRPYASSRRTPPAGPYYGMSHPERVVVERAPMPGPRSSSHHYSSQVSALEVEHGYARESNYVNDPRYMPYTHHPREAVMYNAPPPPCHPPFPGDPIYGGRMTYGAEYAPRAAYTPDSIMMRSNHGFYEKASDQIPTYVGYIKSAHDAILLLSACDISDSTTTSNSTVPPPRRVTRRLLDAERADMVASGCVFAWDEKEAGMKRWTDGRVWSASRVSGCFLTYRELEARKKSNGNALDGPTSNQYKPEGLIKQSFSVCTASGRKLHVISYFTKRDVREGRLRRVSEDPRFVGEAGGEWGLKVDKEEYSFPEGHARAAGHSEQGGDDILDDEDEDNDGLDTPSPPPPPSSEPSQVASVPRKRSLPVDIEVENEKVMTKQPRPPPRPIMLRKRSSSMSNLMISSDNVIDGSKTPSSFQSSTSSNATSVSAEPTTLTKSCQVRALVSPTLPRESAIRGSACDMHPTHSQDSANAVGALLSLASNRSSSRNPGPSPLSASTASESNTGLGLSVKPSPDRRDSDQSALDMFRVRL